MKTVVKAAGIFTVLCVLGWLVLSRDVLHPTLEDMFVHQKQEAGSQNTVSEKLVAYWQSANFSGKTIPEITLLLKDSIPVTTQVIEIMNMNIFVRKALPPQDVVPTNQSILFLHGQRFQSKNWEEIGSLQTMAALGHLAVAIDLPGYGKTGGEQFSGDRAAFLASTLDVLSLHGVVIVSPSMSGQYSIPLLGNYPDTLTGFIPVAPVASDSIPQSKLRQIKVPTLLVFGDGDTTGLAQQSRDSLGVLPYSREAELKSAGHAAYLDQPTLFNAILYNFMELIRLQPRPEATITWRNWKTWRRQGLLSRIK